MTTLAILCMREVESSDCQYFRSVDSLFEHVQSLKYYNGLAEHSATIDWVCDELTHNGVASVHLVAPRFEFCGVHFPAKVTHYVISIISVL